LWDEARKGKYQAIFCLPELLISPAFNKLLKDKGFSNRLAIFIVDECHLIAEWKTFHPAYEGMLAMQARLPVHAAVVGLMATLAP
ncbi:hypothetical protein BS47DRAFT_1269837, partial [Hydnum rufescens UP504]